MFFFIIPKKNVLKETFFLRSMGEGIIVFALWYIAIAYNYYMGYLPAEIPPEQPPVSAPQPPPPPPPPQNQSPKT
ncbi:MHC class II regulatory factor RFX1-like [Melitaea cinxia]|uniref:MHC class II regulatory factor RFX1-like n=1 Tax=Melitaea cinxia TaxID=113334 RepID=UPI001E27129F|nr:MHC class II regulatory factor RFX1-like [Melitaea cinxia]